MSDDSVEMPDTMVKKNENDTVRHAASGHMECGAHAQSRRKSRTATERNDVVSTRSQVR